MRVVVLSLFLFVCCGCQSDAIDTEATVVGRWELTEARRDGTVTNVVRDLTFEFGPDQTFGTNLMGNTQTGTYEKTGENVVTKAVKLPLDYEIQSMTDTTLHLRAEVMGSQFDFELRRAD